MKDKDKCKIGMIKIRIEQVQEIKYNSRKENRILIAQKAKNIQNKTIYFYRYETGNDLMFTTNWHLVVMARSLGKP